MYNMIIEKITDYLKENQKKERTAHSRNVAVFASELAEKFGVDKDKAYLAGFSHDLARDLPEASVRSLAGRDGLPPGDLENKYPVLLHGRAGAVILSEKFGVTDPDILNAVRWHTSARPGLSDLEKVIYIADFLEPGRYYHDKVSYILEKFSSLDDIFKETLCARRTHLIEKNKTVSAETEILYRQLCAAEVRNE